MNQDERLSGLEFATSLSFTEAQYEEALKLVDSPNDRNQLLVALIGVSSRSTNSSHQDFHLVSSSCSQHAKLDGKSSLSSGYSSVSSFPVTTALEDQACDTSNSTHLQNGISNLRKIFIDGSNVARSHSKDGSFSWLGLKICADWFLDRHHFVKVFVPADRCQSADDSIVEYFNKILVQTPTGCNDDLFILEAARSNEGIIVSNDQFREETTKPSDMKSYVRHNRLPYAFVDDLFIPAQDPRGRSGPTLDEFLQHSPFRNVFPGKDQRYRHKPYITRSLDTVEFKAKSYNYSRRSWIDKTASLRLTNSTQTNTSSNRLFENSNEQDVVDLIHFDTPNQIQPDKSKAKEQLGKTEINRHSHNRLRRAI